MQADLQTNLPEGTPGLVFDADSITLLGKFTDELSVYRAKKTWAQVLANYFLLESGRDYEMNIMRPETQGQEYALRCVFGSACGRYAFWRLVNRQAPDAEAKLYTTNIVSKKSQRFLLGSIWNTGSGPWVYDSSKQMDMNEKPSLVRTVLDCIQKAFKTPQ